MMKIKIKVLPHRNKDLPLPQYATEGSAAFDLVANESVVLHQGTLVTIGTGLAMEIPEGGYSLLLCSRSGLTANHGIIVLNAPAVIDGDYRGELKVVLACVAFPNSPRLAPYHINVGDRIAQALLVPAIQTQFKIVEELSETKRGSGGFGSTGR